MSKTSGAALQHVKAAAKPDMVDSEPMELSSFLKPEGDRKVKNTKESRAMKLREVQIPENFFKTFVELAWANDDGKEFMAWILGREDTIPGSKKKTGLFVEGLYVPKQSADGFSVHEMDIGSTRLTQVVGWVHSHPTFDSFLSSVDQHVQFRLQKDFPRAIAVVFDKNKWARVMQLSEAGMKLVAGCKENHDIPHPHDAPLESLLTEVEYYTICSGQRSRLLLCNENDDGKTLDSRFNIFFQNLLFVDASIKDGED